MNTLSRLLSFITFLRAPPGHHRAELASNRLNLVFGIFLAHGEKRGLVVVDLHAVFLMTTGPERATSSTPWCSSSSMNSPTSLPSPANSTVVPSGPESSTFAPLATRPA